MTPHRLLSLSLLLLLNGCPLPGPDPDPDPTPGDDDDDDDDDAVTPPVEERVSFSVSGMLSDGPFNPFHTAVVDTDSPEAFFVDIANNAPDGEAESCGITSDGELSPVCTLHPLGVDGASQVESVDLNGDGRRDLIVASAGSGPAGQTVREGFFQVLMVSGDTVGAPNTFSGATDRPAQFALGDVDGDGDLDLVESSASDPGTLGLSLGNGDGTFAAAQTVALSGFATDVTCADLDGDGVDEVIALVDDGDTTALDVYGADLGTPTRHVAYGPLGGFRVEAGDLDGDGDDDLLTSTLYETVIYLAEDGALGEPLRFDGSVINFPQVIDLDGDGALDLVGTNAGAVGFSAFYGDGAGSFEARQDMVLGIGGWRWAEAGDLTGDGLPDLVITGFHLELGNMLVATQQ